MSQMKCRKYQAIILLLSFCFSLAHAAEPGFSEYAEVLIPTDDANNRVMLDGELAVSKWEHAFFRFDLSTIATPVAQAVFRVYHNGQLSPLTLQLAKSVDDWSETTETPAITQYSSDSSLWIGNGVTVEGEGYVDFDASDYISSEMNGDGVASFELSSETSLWSRVDSKEGVNPPQLIIDSNEPPVAFMSIQGDSEDYQTYHYSAQSAFDRDGSIVSYEWDFGDGAVSSEIETSHTYSADGIYVVTLNVTDDMGATSTATKTLYVTKPIETISLSPVAEGNNRALLPDTLALSRWEHAFLKFDLSANQEYIRSAVLRVYHNGVNTPLSMYVGAVEDDWAGDVDTPFITLIEFSPAHQLAATTVAEAGYIELDLTNYVREEQLQDGFVSVELSSDTRTWSRLDSSEGINPPELIITTGSESQTVWSLPMLVDTNTNNTSQAKIVTDPDGNFMAIWVQGNQQIGHMWSRRYTQHRDGVRQK